MSIVPQLRETSEATQQHEHSTAALGDIDHHGTSFAGHSQHGVMAPKINIRCAQPLHCIPHSSSIAQGCVQARLFARHKSASFHAAGVRIKHIFEAALAMKETLGEDCPAELLEGISRVWWENPEVRQRLMDDSVTLILPAEGDKAPQPSQQCALTNGMILGPVLFRMHMFQTLKIPSVEMLAAEMLSLWSLQCRAKQRKKTEKGRLPMLDAEFRIPEAVQAQCHLDAKSAKTLLSTLRKQFLSDRVAKEA